MSEKVPTDPWNEDTLGTICRNGGGSIQTGPFGSQLHAEDYKLEGIPIITVEHLDNGRIAHRNLPLVGAHDYRRLGRYRLSEGDLVFSRVGAIDRCVYVSHDEEGWLFSGRCLRVRVGNGAIDSRFLSYLLNAWTSRQWILNHSVGSTMACLNTTILSRLPIACPKPPAQSLIAEILSTVDEAIEQTEALIAKYQQIKAGLMHDLFTRGLTPQGNLRPTPTEAPNLYKPSPLGLIPKEWEAAPLGRHAEIVSGVTLGNGEVTVGGIEVPYLRVANVQDGFIDLSEIKTITISRIQLEKWVLREGDVLMNEGGDFDKLGRGAVWDGAVDPCIHQNHVFRVRPRSGDLRSRYLSYWSQSSFGRRYFVLSSKQSTNLASINSTQLKAFPVAICPRDEQLEIEIRLGMLDEYLADLSVSRSKLRQQKLGLMQDLLTGSVRVPIPDAEEPAA